MGGLLYPFDSEYTSMAKKIFNQKRRNGGLETPRNSLDLQIESSQYYCAAEEIPYSYEIDEVFSDKDYYQNEASMKKLIDKEMSRRTNTRHNGPNIVARLMGMDMLPLDEKDKIQPCDQRHDEKGLKVLNKERNGSNLHSHASSKLNSFQQMGLHLSYHDNDKDSDRLSSSKKVGKPHRREHPQEEELQKFKKEFEAWQAARFRECSRIIEVGSIYRQSLAQEDLAKDKMTLHENSRKVSSQKPSEQKGSTVEMKSYKDIGWDNGFRVEISPAEHRRPFSLRSKSMDADFEHPCLTSSVQKTDKSCGPTKIVILKPGPDRMYHHEENWTSSPGTLVERVSIEDFLEEVKERLKCELQGKNSKKGSAARGSGIETRYSEKPSHSKQKVRNIETQFRDSVTSDLRTNTLRSESTRSYKGEIQFNGLSSPEFINKDARNILSEKLRNVQRKDPDLDSDSSRSSVYDNEEQVEATMTTRKHTNYWEIVRDAEETQARSFRHEVNNYEVLPRDLSPKNLIRSLSAPVSGTSFGKLLLEDRHILTGVHIQRKHEASDNVTVNSKKQKKEKFNFKEKVSNFRYNFSLRGKLFGRKTQSITGSRATDLYSMKDILSGPTVVMKFGERHEKENFTEVPPSPASVCSSIQEEFWKLSDHHSPISTSDVTPGDENCVSQVFREISSNLKELRRQLNQLESNDFEDEVEQQPVESEITQLEDPSESYIRDLLIVSGMYDGSPNKKNSRKTTVTKPISDAIFEEVEEAYRKSEKENKIFEKEKNETIVYHKLLFDLLNEALPTVLAPCLTMSRFRRKVIDSSMLPPLSGKKLLESVLDLDIISKFIHSPTDRSYYLLEGVMARDLNSTRWSTLIDDEVNMTGREVESLIIRDLVEEIVKDMRK